MRHMIATRKKYQAFGHGSLEWLDLESQAVAAYLRLCEGERLVIINNLSDQRQAVKLGLGANSFTDLLGGRVLTAKDGQLQVDLEPYEYLWLHG